MDVEKSLAKFNEQASITIGKIVALVCSCLVIAYVLPVGLSALGSMNTSGMNDGEIALISALGIIIVLVVFSMVAKEAE